MDPLEFASIRNLDTQKVVRAARHQKTLLDFGIPSDGRFKTIQVILGLPLECNVDDHGHRGLCVRRFDQRCVPPYNAGLLHQPNTAQAS